jgi:hypothetical protein
MKIDATSKGRDLRGAVTLKDLMFLVLLVTLVPVAAFRGMALGMHHGAFGGVVGFGLGALAGVASWLAVIIMTEAISGIESSFWKRFRPYPPTCESGTCQGHGGYDACETPRNVREECGGISPVCWRCRCGYLYVGGSPGPRSGRWMRIGKDGKLHPYLKHRILGRWEPDHEQCEPV